MSFGGLFKTGNQLFKALNADMGSRFQATAPEDSDSDDEADPTLISYGKRGTSVYKDISSRKIIHLDHEARAIRFYREGQKKRKTYRLSGLNSIFRPSENVIMFETKRSKALNAKVITLANEEVATEFLTSVMYLLDYGDIVLSSFYFMVENKRGLLNISGLHSALQLYDMNEGLTNKDLQLILDLADEPGQFDFLDYFKNMIGTPVSNHRDCLQTLLKKSLIKSNHPLSRHDSMKCLDENLPFTLDTRLINGETVLDTAFFTRWLVASTHDKDVFTSGCTEVLDSASNFSHSGSISRCVHLSSKPGFIGHILLTDYRIVFQNIHKSSVREHANYTRYNNPRFFDKMSVPLASITSVILKPEPTNLLQKIHIKIKTKDHRKLRLIFLKNGTTYDMAKMLYQKIVSLCFASRNIERSMFCFKYKETFYEQQTWSWSDTLRDYTRLGLVKNPDWKIIENSGHVDEQLCETYPSYLVVPADLSQEHLKNCLAFRSKKRLPVVTYIHRETQACLTRSSQTLSTSGTKNLQSDVHLLNLYRSSGLFNQLREEEFRPATFYIFDARSMMAALANMAAGRGTEEVDNYNHTEIIFCGIDNIHVMRTSYEAICSAVLVDGKCPLSEMDSVHLSSLQKGSSTISHREEQFDFMKKVDASNWITHCSKVLMASVLMAEKLHLEGCSCLVHCSDGWDRTAQMAALTQMILDPYYRSFEGFAVVIEKEFCSFGHKFDDRCGHLRLSSAKDAEERSPIFIQFLDVVHNILHQFPNSFEFNQELLVFLADHVYSCLFGNFLGNSETERFHTLNVRQKTQSLWSYVLSQKSHFFNDQYKSGADQPKVIWPAFNPRSMRLWERFFLRWTVNAHLPASPWHDDWGSQRETNLSDEDEGKIEVESSTVAGSRPSSTPRPTMARVHSTRGIAVTPLSPEKDNSKEDVVEDSGTIEEDIHTSASTCTGVDVSSNINSDPHHLDVAANANLMTASLEEDEGEETCSV